MDITVLILSVLACVLVSALLDQLIKPIAAPLIQIALGVALFFLLGGKESFVIEPEVFMLIFVVPLLYKEARDVDRAALLQNKGAVFALAVLLVVVITFSVGLTLNLIVPTISIAAACTLGAALAPTDAVAVTSLPEDVNISSRIRGILKGECLFNDASGIVAFEFALLAASTGKFSASDASVNFVIVFLGGAVVGVAIGIVFNLLDKLISTLDLDNPTFVVLFDVFMPFLIYYVADCFNVSGVIAVVAAGIVIALSKKHTTPHISKIRIVSTSVWNVLSFTLNGVVFVLLGCMLPSPIKNAIDDIGISNGQLFVYAAAVAVALIGVRFLLCYIMESNSKSDEDLSAARRAAILTFGGAKGAVTMAIVLSIPVSATITAGTREILVFIAGVVCLLTLLCSNFILPAIVPKAKDTSKVDDALQASSQAVMAKILRQVSATLAAEQTPQTRHATSIVLETYTKRIDEMEQVGASSAHVVKLQTYALQLQQDFVNTLINRRQVDLHLAYRYIKSLTRQQALLTHNNKFFWRISAWISKTFEAFRSAPEKTKNVAVSNTARPDETVIFSTGKFAAKSEKIEDLRDLKIAAYSHVINVLNNDLAEKSKIAKPKLNVQGQGDFAVDTSSKQSVAFGNVDFAAEEISRVISIYRNELNALQDKAQSVEAKQALDAQVNEIYNHALFLETQYLEQMMRSSQLTRQQYEIVRDQINLMTLSREEF